MTDATLEKIVGWLHAVNTTGRIIRFVPMHVIFAGDALTEVSVVPFLEAVPRERSATPAEVMEVHATICPDAVVHESVDSEIFVQHLIALADQPLDFQLAVMFEMSDHHFGEWFSKWCASLSKEEMVVFVV